MGFRNFGASLTKAGAPTSGVLQVETAVIAVLTNEQQQIAESGGQVTGGTFTVTYSGQTTSAIAFDATAATVQTALEALSNLAPGDVVLSGGPINTAPIIITFQGTLAGTNVAEVTIDSALLTGGGTYTPSTVVTGGVASTISQAGNIEVIVTAAGMTGSPKTINVAVALNDDADAVAGKIRTALAADADVAAMFTVGGLGANVALTAIKSAADDATLNIAVDNGTAAGLTPDATSNNTTAGVKGDYRGAGRSSVMVDTTNANLYENSGNDNQPVWTLM